MGIQLKSQLCLSTLFQFWLNAKQKPAVSRVVCIAGFPPPRLFACGIERSDLGPIVILLSVAANNTAKPGLAVVG